MSKQRYYGLGLFQDAWLGCPTTLSLQIFTGCKEDNGAIDDSDELCDYEFIEEIFKNCGKKISVGAAENLHRLFGTDEKELRLLASTILEANGYIHNPEWDCNE